MTEVGMRLKSVLAMSSPNPFLPPLKQWVLVWQLYTWDAANFVLLPLNQKSNPNNSLASIKQTPWKVTKMNKMRTRLKKDNCFWGVFSSKENSFNTCAQGFGDGFIYSHESSTYFINFPCSASSPLVQCEPGKLPLRPP